MLVAESSRVNAFVSLHPTKADFSQPQQYYKDWKWEKVKNLARVAEIATTAVWSDSIWYQGRRKEDNWRVSYFCVLDVDSGYSLSQAIKELCDTNHVIGTTKSHGIKGDRFRIILPWSKSVRNLDIYRYSLEKLIQNYDADPSGVDGARFFWPCKEIVSIVEDAEYLTDTIELPEHYQPALAKQIQAAVTYKNYGELKVLPPWIRHVLTTGVPEGQRNTYVYSIAKNMTYFGMTEEEIKAMIIGSKVPLPTAPEREIDLAIKSGAKKARKIMDIQNQRSGK